MKDMLDNVVLVAFGLVSLGAIFALLGCVIVTAAEAF